MVLCNTNFYLKQPRHALPLRHHVWLYLRPVQATAGTPGLQDHALPLQHHVTSCHVTSCDVAVAVHDLTVQVLQL